MGGRALIMIGFRFGCGVRGQPMTKCEKCPGQDHINMLNKQQEEERGREVAGVERYERLDCALSINVCLVSSAEGLTHCILIVGMHQERHLQIQLRYVLLQFDNGLLDLLHGA